MMVDVLTVAIKCGQDVWQIQHRWLTPPQVQAGPLPCFCGGPMQAGHIGNSFAHNFKYCRCQLRCEVAGRLVSVPFHNAGVVVGAVVKALAAGIRQAFEPPRYICSFDLAQSPASTAVSVWAVRGTDYTNATLQSLYRWKDKP